MLPLLGESEEEIERVVLRGGDVDPGLLPRLEAGGGSVAVRGVLAAHRVDQPVLDRGRSHGRDRPVWGHFLGEASRRQARG